MKKFLVFVTILLLMQGAWAQKKVKITAPRPKVGVVLAGGGAKGAAHIGVLKYLDEMGIPIDYVAGTSMGSIMAGLYAMGYTPDELAELIAGIDWNAYIGNKIDRQMLSNEMRLRRTTTFINIPFGTDRLFNKTGNGSILSDLPSAYVNNSSLINLFNDLCVGYQEEMDFNDLPIPFACVATDLITGEEVDIRSGSVPSAIRASMAIPGVFSPVVIGDKVLVDGGLVNNFPADVLKQMGADIIIGVEITKDEKITTEDLKSLPQVMSGLLSNITNGKRIENRQLCDIYIVPDITGYGMLSFSHDAIDTLVHRGYRKAIEYHDQLLALKQYVDQKAGYPVTTTLNAPKAKNLETEPVLIRSVEFSGVSARDSNWMMRKGGLVPGKRIEKKDIERAVDLYRGTGAFDEITYTVMKSDPDKVHESGLDEEMYDLHISTKPAAPHVFGVGLHYDTDEGTGLLFNVGINEKKFNGSKLYFGAKLSYCPHLNLTYTYSRSSLANFNFSIDYRNDYYKMWVLQDKNINMRYFQWKLTASISQFHLLNLNTSVGFSYVYTGYDQPSLEGSDMDTAYYTIKHLVPYVNVVYDNLDDAYFANRGVYARLSSHFYWYPEDGTRNVFDINLAFKYYYSFWGDRLTIIPQVYGRYVKDEFFPWIWTYYGGELAGRHFEEQLPFVGSFPLTLTGGFATVFRFDLRYRFLEKHYLTGMYNKFVDFSSPHPFSALYGNESGVGLKYSFDSFIGPVSFTVQWSEYRKQVSAYLSIGYYF